MKVGLCKSEQVYWRTELFSIVWGVTEDMGDEEALFIASNCCSYVPYFRMGHKLKHVWYCPECEKVVHEISDTSSNYSTAAASYCRDRTNEYAKWFVDSVIGGWFMYWMDSEEPVYVEFN